MYQWGLARWFIFISKYSSCSGMNIAVFTSGVVLCLVSDVIGFNIFAKPKHTGLFILERCGASGKDQLKALFLPSSGFGSSVQRFSPAVERSIHPNLLPGMTS